MAAKQTLRPRGAEGGIWTLAPVLSQPTPLAGEPLRPLGYFCRYDIHWLKMWRREWDSNPRTLARRRFSRPVPSTARTSLHHGKAPSVGRLIIILYRLAICQQSPLNFIFLIFFILGVAFPETVCYYNWADFEQHISGCGAVGSALDWGSRGREFKSRHSDQVMIIRTTLSKWVVCSDLSFLLKIYFSRQGQELTSCPFLLLLL